MNKLVLMDVIHGQIDAIENSQAYLDLNRRQISAQRAGSER